MSLNSKTLRWGSPEINGGIFVVYDICACISTYMFIIRTFVNTCINKHNDKEYKHKIVTQLNKIKLYFTNAMLKI